MIVNAVDSRRFMNNKDDITIHPHQCNGVDGARRHGTANKCTICGEYSSQWNSGSAEDITIQPPPIKPDEAVQEIIEKMVREHLQKELPDADKAAVELMVSGYTPIGTAIHESLVAQLSASKEREHRWELALVGQNQLIEKIYKCDKCGSRRMADSFQPPPIKDEDNFEVDYDGPCLCDHPRDEDCRAAIAESPETPGWMYTCNLLKGHDGNHMACRHGVAMWSDGGTIHPNRRLAALVAQLSTLSLERDKAIEREKALRLMLHCAESISSDAWEIFQAAPDRWLALIDGEKTAGAYDSPDDAFYSQIHPELKEKK